MLPSTHDWELSSRLIGRLSYCNGGIYTFPSTFKPDFYCNWNKAPCSRFSKKACCSLNPEPAYTNGDNEAFLTTTKAAWQLLTKIPTPQRRSRPLFTCNVGRKLAVDTLQRQCWWQLAAYCRAEPRRSPPALSGSVHCRPVPHAPPAQRHGFPSLKNNSPEEAQKQKPRMTIQQQQQEEVQARAAICGDGGKELCDRSNGRTTTTTTTQPCLLCRIMNKINRILGWKFQRLSNGWK